MNLTEFEWTKTELRWIFYGQKKVSGNFVNIENVFSIKPMRFTFSTQQSVFSEGVKDCGFEI